MPDCLPPLSHLRGILPSALAAQHRDGPGRLGAPVMGTVIDAGRPSEVCAQIIAWAQAGQSRCVAFANVHSVVTAHRNPAFARVLAGCDLVLPDGAPVAWALRRQGHVEQRRVCGPDLVDPLLAQLSEARLPVFLFGSTPSTLDKFTRALAGRHPGLLIAGSYSPPFGEWSDEERAHQRALLAASGARVVLVGLGCPKQEAWMVSVRDSLPAVTLGLGAAFDFHAGTVPRAPAWMRNAGLEWLHRWVQEPRRLTRRYVQTSLPFLRWAAGLLLRGRGAGR